MVTATGSTSNATTDKINNSRNSLASNEQTFLKLLTTQLKNQDPLSPTDTTQMTSQITQMTGVEQQLVTNDLLAALVGMSTGGGISEGVNLMGKQVTAETDKSVLKNKEASWSYTQSRAATGVKIEVLDKFDKVIATILPDDMAGGDHTFKWDGKSTPAGVQQPEGGEYTIKVTATDSQGSNITTTAKGRIDGIVTKVTNESGVNMVWIGDTKVPLDSVIGVTNAAANTPKDDEDKAAA
jgi:flagellar basal-body rod modification protein FlgD